MEKAESEDHSKVPHKANIND